MAKRSPRRLLGYACPTPRTLRDLIRTVTLPKPRTLDAVTVKKGP